MPTCFHISSRGPHARKKLIVIILMFAFGSNVLEAQQQPSAGSPTTEELLRTKRQEALRLSKAGESKQAVKIAMELVEQSGAEKGLRSFEFAVAWETLGVVQQRAGASSKAETALRESLAVQRRTGYIGPRFESLTLCLLSSVIESSGRLEDAATALDEAIALSS